MSVAARRYWTRGQAALDSGDTSQAIDLFQSAVDLAPYFVAARVGHATALSRLGDHPRAASTLRTGVARARTAPGRATLLAALGDALIAGGDFMSADEAYRRAGQVDGFEARSRAGLARVAARLGKLAEAFEHLHAIS